jgi:hypothetical protein
MGACEITASIRDGSIGLPAAICLRAVNSTGRRREEGEEVDGDDDGKVGEIDGNAAVVVEMLALWVRAE